jgi:hypothetical protein
MFTPDLRLAGWPDKFVTKIAQNVAQKVYFWSTLICIYVAFTVEKSSNRKWLLYFKKLTKINNLAQGREIAQSGHLVIRVYAYSNTTWQYVLDWRPKGFVCLSQQVRFSSSHVGLPRRQWTFFSKILTKKFAEIKSWCHSRRVPTFISSFKHSLEWDCIKVRAERTSASLEQGCQMAYF